MQMSFYFVACTCKIDTVTDFAGSSTPDSIETPASI